MTMGKIPADKVKLWEKLAKRLRASLWRTNMCFQKRVAATNMFLLSRVSALTAAHYCKPAWFTQCQAVTNAIFAASGKRIRELPIRLG